MASPTSIRCGLPDWLQASKGICHSGIEELRRKVIWSFWLEHCRDINDNCSALISPASATKALLYGRVTVQWPEADKWRIPSPDVQTTYTKIVAYPCYPGGTSRPLSTIIAKLGTDANHLAFHFDAHLPRRYFSSNPVATWKADFSFLDKLTLRLDLLSTDGRMTFNEDPRYFLPSLQAAFEIEISRLGSSLVGQNGRIEYLEKLEEVNLTSSHQFDVAFTVAYTKNEVQVL